MKKIVLSLAVIASVALVACNKGNAAAESETVAAETTEVMDTANAEAPAADTNAPVAESANAEAAPAADTAVAK